MINQTITAILLLIASTQIIFIFGEISLTDDAQWSFAVNLLQKVAEDDKSVVVSPFALSTSLFMVYLAAKGVTKQQLYDVLGGSASTLEFQLYFKTVLDDVARLKSYDYALNFESHLFVKQDALTEESFAGKHRFYFNERLNKLNLKKKDEIVENMDNMFSSENKMMDMITVDSISGDTYILFMNAIYFKGTWNKQFLTVTRPEGFHISEHEIITIPMMRKSEELPYYEDDLVKFIKMPYIGSRIEMALILPKTRFDLSNVLKNLTGEKLLKYVSSAQRKHVSISLPKFRLEERLNLTSVLQQIGIRNVFGETADFKELLKEQVSTRISKFMHAGFIEVNEQGTEPVEDLQDTATQLEQRPLSVMHTFIADQPFLFAIITDLKSILFAGQFVKPSVG